MYKLLTALLFVALTSVSAYAGPQERGMITGAAIGGTAGAVIGSQSNETVQGAIVGAMFGAIAGAILTNRTQAVPVRHRVHHQPVHVQKRNHWRSQRYSRHDRRAHYGSKRYNRQDRHTYQRDHSRYSSHDVKRGKQGYRSHAEQVIDRRHYRDDGKRLQNRDFSRRSGNVSRHQRNNRSHS